MAVERRLLLLADIGGYTEFVRLHRVNLAHSQEITQRLLESMLDAVPGLRLVEVEGDALFMSARHEDGDADAPSGGWLPFALDMYRAFHERQQWMVAHNLCACDACRQIGRLRVKFAAHLGDVATQTIRDRAKLFGVDVITVHRMLKNSVPAGEYVLMSEPLHDRSHPDLRARAVRIEEQLEGLGTVPLYFVDLEEFPLELPPVPQPTLTARVRATMGVGLPALPAVLGLRRHG
jgi:uncharacterized protein DUF2652